MLRITFTFFLTTKINTAGLYFEILCFFFWFFDHAPSIDTHNHVRTGYMDLEDVIVAKSPHFWQFTGILEFLVTKSYLAYKYFNQFKRTWSMLLSKLQKQINCK